MKNKIFLYFPLLLLVFFSCNKKNKHYLTTSNYITNFYKTGVKKSEGKINDSLKTGLWSYYDKHGDKESIVEYVCFDNNEKVNKVYKLNKTGDTIGGNYYNFSYQDTVNLGERNRFYFSLTAPVLSDTSEVYILLSNNKNKECFNFDNIYDTVPSLAKRFENKNLYQDRKNDVVFDIYPEVKGVNVIEGALIERVPSKDDSIDFITRELFFRHSFFVK